MPENLLVCWWQSPLLYYLHTFARGLQSEIEWMYAVVKLPGVETAEIEAEETCGEAEDDKDNGDFPLL
jgi:hypothetical protein